MKRLIGVCLVAAGLAACSSHKAPPATPAGSPVAVPALDVPADVSVSAAVRQKHEAAFALLQAGDLKGAERGFSDALKTAPGFYPAETGLGYVSLTGRHYKDAVARFGAAVNHGPKYLPALQGQVEAQLGASDTLGAIMAIDQLLAVDPSRDDMRSRLDVLRLRQVQSDLDAATKARTSGFPDQARRILDRAVETTPTSGLLVRELARADLAAGDAEAAETHARKAVELDSEDAEAHAVLGDVLEARGQFREAAGAYGRAVQIDPRQAWREKRDALLAHAVQDELPAEYRAIGTAASVTRGQVAAMIAMDLPSVVSRAPQRQTADVITDIRNYWAAASIMSVSQAGLMDARPNHTFQPNAVVQRADLAQVVSRVLNQIAARRPSDAEAWRSARPVFPDVGVGHAAYGAIAAAVASGAMRVDADGRFVPARPASGEDLTAAVARLRQLAGR